MKLRAPLCGLLALAASSVPAFAEEAAEDVGFPQLKQVDTYAGQVFWLAISLFVLYLLMSRLALPGVGEVLEKRRKTRQDDLKEAENLSQEADKVKKAYEASLARAQGAAQELTRNAEQDIANRIAAETSKFGEAARKRLAEAEQAIGRARQEAMASLADIASDIAVDMTGKIAGVQVSKADAKIAVAGAMKEQAP